MRAHQNPWSSAPRFAATVAVVALFLLTGCTAGSPSSSPTPASLPDGVEVELFQLRSDVADRGAQLRVINGSGDDLVITGLAVHDDWFAGPATRERTSTIPAGRTVDLRFALPESACDDAPDAAARTSRVTLELEGGTSVTADLADPLGFTALIHEKECLRHDLAQIATLEWTSFTPAVAPLPAQLELTVTSTGTTGTARVLEVQTTNLVQFADRPAPFAVDLDISPSTDASTVAVPVDRTVPVIRTVPLIPLRCDPHVVMEDKRGTVFNVSVQVGDASGVVEVAASDTMRGRILRWVADWCGFGPGSG